MREVKGRRLLTLDGNVFVAALKADEPYSDDCSKILAKVPDDFILVEPSIVYLEVLGTLARKVGVSEALVGKTMLDDMISPILLVTCDRDFCIEAFPLCSTYDVYAIDSLYLKTALDVHAILVSLDKEDFVNRIKEKAPPIEVYHVSEFPY
mgnify:CR=1 FL=1